ETQTRPASKPEPEAEAEAKPETQTGPASKPEPEAEAEAKPETQTGPASKPEPQPQPQPEAEPEPGAQTEAEAESDAKPVSVAKPEAEAEPKAEAEPETQTEPKSEPKAEAEPEALAEAEAKPETEAEPAAKPEAKQEPEPEPEAEAPPVPAPATTSATTPTPTPAPEPAAADGEQPPQGPPAPDNESRTGGAGGNTRAEGAAEAPKPATPPTRIRSRAPGLTTAYKAAATALKKHDLTGTRAKVHLVLDRSASMRPYYKDGSAQALAEQTLALAAHLDPEATVHVTFFSTEVDGTGDLTLTDHENKIDELHAALGRMGRTSYHAAVEAVLTHHAKEEPPGTPALVVFQTDGAPDAKTPATQSLTDAAANHPNVHFSFVAFGDPENKAFDYLRKLKTGNTSHFLAGETPKELTDKELYEGVLATWRP
ncbi:VWA domain-containing protein, partial [Streptomyces sp. NPDC029519]|uniref:VWA domain-containing protein n=1 Tax=Streptomyces sp. NPDC029519 TaxID=3155364 RepID=UPI0033C72C7A